MMESEDAVVVAFNQCWDAKGMHVEWREKLHPHIEQAVNSCLLKGDRFCVLSIGSGYGDCDLGLMQFLNKKYPSLKMHFTVVEPDESSMSSFKQQFHDLPESVSNYVQMSWHLCGVEDFLQQEQGPPYHLIHLFYCIQFLTDYMAFLRHLYSTLAPFGVAAIVGFSKDSISYGCIGKEFSQPGKFLHGVQQQKELFNEDIVSKLAETGWKYEMFIAKYSCDVTACFNAESSTGILLLSQLLNIDPREVEISKEQKEEVLAFIKTKVIRRDFAGQGERDCVDDSAHFIFLCKGVNA